MKAPAVYRINAADGTRTEIAKESVSGLEFGPDGLLYGCQGAKNRVISIDVKTGEVKRGRKRRQAQRSGRHDRRLHLHHRNRSSAGDSHQPQDRRSHAGRHRHHPTQRHRPVQRRRNAGGVRLRWRASPGRSASTPTASLDAKMPTMPMRLPIDPKGNSNSTNRRPTVTASRGDGMAVDKAGRYYVTSALGVQIFDPTGRPCGVLPKPDRDQPLTTCMLAGPNHEYLVHHQRVNCLPPQTVHRMRRHSAQILSPRHASSPCFELNGVNSSDS